MTANLFNHTRLEAIDNAIAANREAAALLVSDRSPEASVRMGQLNAAWFELGTERHRLTGQDPAPYTMGRT